MSRRSQPPSPVRTSRFRRERDRIERALIQRYIIACNGNLCSAARLMGIYQQNLIRYVKHHQLEAFVTECREKAVDNGQKFVNAAGAALSEITEVMLTDILQDALDEEPPLPVPEPPLAELPPLRVIGLFAPVPVDDEAQTEAVDAEAAVEAVEAPREPAAYAPGLPEDPQPDDEFPDEDSEDEAAEGG